MTLLLKETPEELILRIADSLQPAIRKTFLDAIEALKRKVPVGKITQLLEEGNITGILDALDDVKLTSQELASIRDTIQDAVLRVAKPTAAEFGLSFDLVQPRAVRWATEQAGKLIVQIDSETRAAVADIVSTGLREGVAPRQQALLIREIVGLTRRDAGAVKRFLRGAEESGMRLGQARAEAERMTRRLLRRRAMTIARTETIRAANMGTQLAWESAKDQGLLPPDTQKVWIATEDARLCPICAVLNGQAIDLGNKFDIQEQATSFTVEGGNIQVAEREAVRNPTTELTPPAHASCLPGDTLISTRGGIAATSKRVYIGDLVVLRTDQHWLRLTPNHPVLTRNGWVAAGRLNVGDDVVGGSFGELEVVGDVYDQDMPTPIKEVAESFRQSRLVGSRPVVVTAEDFHSDGKNSEVAVINVDTLLWDNQQITLDEPMNQHSLVGGHVQMPVQSYGFGLPDTFGFSGGTTSTRHVSSSSLVRSYCFAHATPLNHFGFGPSPDRRSGFDKPAADDGASDTEVVCKSLFGFASEVSVHKVVNVEVVSFHGPVYNLETTTGYYIADGLVVHNCRCTTGIA